LSKCNKTFLRTWRVLQKDGVHERIFIRACVTATGPPHSVTRQHWAFQLSPTWKQRKTHKSK